MTWTKRIYRPWILLAGFLLALLTLAFGAPAFLAIRRVICFPVHRAAGKGDVATIKKLLTSGTSIDARNDDGLTSLHVAAWYGRTAAVRLLLDEGASIAARNTDGHTALHIAALQGHTEIVKLLLDGGADIDARDPYKNSPLILAAYEGRKEVMKLFIAEGASDVMWAAIIAKDAETLVAAMERGHGVDTELVSGQTPLIEALDAGSEDIVALLLCAGADICKEQRDGWTPLEVVVKREDKKSLALFVASGREIPAEAQSSANDTEVQRALSQARRTLRSARERLRNARLLDK